MVRMLNDIFSNDFFLLVDLKQNVIEMDQHFWDLNINFQGKCAIPTYRHYMHIRSHKSVNNSELIEDV